MRSRAGVESQPFSCDRVSHRPPIKGPSLEPIGLYFSLNRLADYNNETSGVAHRFVRDPVSHEPQRAQFRVLLGCIEPKWAGISS